MTLSIYILIALILVSVEIIYDKWRWSHGKDDKPGSTWLRAGLITLYGIIIFVWTNDIIYTLQCVAVIAGTFFLTFDFALNVVRWKDLPMPYYAPYNQAYNSYIKSDYSTIQSKELAYEDLTTWEKVVYKITIFSGRFFWHGDELTTSWYDLFFQRVPPQGELLLKGIVMYMAVYWYFN